MSSILAEAQTQIGESEGPNNDVPYGAPVGLPNHVYWCAVFICWCAARAGVKLPLVTAGAAALLKALVDSGAKVVPGPVRGALVGYAFPSESGAGRWMGINHIAVVESAHDDGSWVDVEGNTNKLGSRSGGMVLRKNRSKYAVIFVIPPAAATPPPPPPTPDSVLLSGTFHRHIARGMRGGDVRAAKHSLIGQKFLSPDALTGPTANVVTEDVVAAIRRLQHAHGVVPNNYISRREAVWLTPGAKA